MKVKDLIFQLKKIPEDTEVFFVSFDEYIYKSDEKEEFLFSLSTEKPEISEVLEGGYEVYKDTFNKHFSTINEEDLKKVKGICF